MIEQSKEFNISNANKGYLPQVSFSAKATYQSAVTKLPITLPNVTIEGLNKDQYQSVVEVNQSIWDGGVIRNQKKITEASSAVDKQKLDVDMYAINDRVNQLFFGILLIDEQIKQNLLLQDELKRNYNQISAYITNGIANQADLDAVKVNQLSTAQRKVELDATRKAYREMLSALIGEEIKEGTSLVKPSFAEEASLSSTVNRPELRLFEAQSNLFETQKSMMTSISIVREKETGTMEILLVSPVKPIYIILAKAIPYMALSCINIITILLLSVFVLDVPIAGSLVLLFGVSLLFIIVSLALGLLISTIAETQVAAMLVSGMVLMMPVMILSGMIYPTENMPVMLQMISNIIPAKWYIIAVKKIMIEGLDISFVLKEIGILSFMTPQINIFQSKVALNSSLFCQVQ